MRATCLSVMRSDAAISRMVQPGRSEITRSTAPWFETMFHSFFSGITASLAVVDIIMSENEAAVMTQLSGRNAHLFRCAYGNRK